MRRLFISAVALNALLCTGHAAEHNTRESQTDLEDGSDDTTEDSPGRDCDARLEDDLLSGGVGVDVSLVYVVGVERGDGELLRVGGAGDGHEELESDEERSSLAEKVRSHSGGHEAVAGFRDGDGQIERAASKTERGGHAEGDGEPGHAAQEIALPGRARLARDGALPVALVGEDRAEVAHHVLLPIENVSGTVCAHVWRRWQRDARNSDGKRARVLRRE